MVRQVQQRVLRVALLPCVELEHPRRPGLASAQLSRAHLQEDRLSRPPFPIDEVKARPLACHQLLAKSHNEAVPFEAISHRLRVAAPTGSLLPERHDVGIESQPHAGMWLVSRRCSCTRAYIESVPGVRVLRIEFETASKDQPALASPS